MYTEEKLRELFTVDDPKTKTSKDEFDVLPKQDLLEELGHHGTCAVVSSSGRMLLHEHGDAIDGHDFVIRFNHAQVKGFEKHVGSKTDLLVFNSQLGGREKAMPLFAEARASIMRDFHTNVLDFARSGFHSVPNYVRLRRQSPKSVYVANNHFNKFVASVWNLGASPSSGFLGIILALQLCDVVDVYEVAPSRKPFGQTYYWLPGGNATRRSQWHAYAQEQAFLLNRSITPKPETEHTGMVRLTASKDLQYACSQAFHPTGF
jgi:hypothetical protein